MLNARRKHPLLLYYLSARIICIVIDHSIAAFQTLLTDEIDVGISSRSEFWPEELLSGNPPLAKEKDDMPPAVVIVATVSWNPTRLPSITA
mmetsp:Transcript_31634/g.68434  ORF Transcript_31634/g.68434 Transcript_31634/m.68434 type:complete len:91 (-) Transcript_31634:2017-2289(-)